MRASIVIPTFNRKEKVCLLLQRLAPQVSHDIEVIVVVDGSTDGTFEQLEKSQFDIKNLTLINQGNKGRAGARNSGAFSAKAPIIVFFDDDIIPTDSLLQDHIAAHKRFDIVVGGLKSKDIHGNKEMYIFSEYLNQKWTKDINQNVAPYITANNFSIKIEIFTSVGGFDERLNDSEDLDLAIRLTMKGYTISQLNELVAFLPLNATFSETFRRLKEYKAGRVVLNNTNPVVKDYIPSNVFPNPLKRLFFFLFSFSFLYRLVDQGFFLFLPKAWRMKIYDWMMTGNMMY